MVARQADFGTNNCSDRNKTLLSGLQEEIYRLTRDRNDFTDVP
jgi:hypothetical protein